MKVVLSSQMKFFKETQSASAEEGKNMSESLLTSSKSTAELINTTKELSIAQKAARKESSAFGKLLQGLAINLSYYWSQLGTIFNGIGTIVERVILRIENGIDRLIKNNIKKINTLIFLINFLNKNTGIEPIKFFTQDGLDKNIAKRKKNNSNQDIETISLSDIPNTDDKFIWSFKGGFWADELGDYAVALQDRCVK